MKRLLSKHYANFGAFSELMYDTCLKMAGTRVDYSLSYMVHEQIKSKITNFNNVIAMDLYVLLSNSQDLHEAYRL